MKKRSNEGNDQSIPAKNVHHKFRSTMSDKENEKVKKAIADIDAAQHSDLESPGWTTAKGNYTQLGQKRQLDIEDAESSKRKASEIRWATCLFQLTYFAASPHGYSKNSLFTARHTRGCWQRSI